jgi:hypothetical protein
MHAFENLAKICKCMQIQTETIESLCNDWYRFLKFHMIGVIKKNMLFILCTTQLIKLSSFQFEILWKCRDFFGGQYTLSPYSLFQSLRSVQTLSF